MNPSIGQYSKCAEVLNLSIASGDITDSADIAIICRAHEIIDELSQKLEKDYLQKRLDAVRGVSDSPGAIGWLVDRLEKALKEM